MSSFKTQIFLDFTLQFLSVPGASKEIVEVCLAEFLLDSSITCVDVSDFESEIKTLKSAHVLDPQ